MKRLVGLGIVVAVIAALLLAHQAVAARGGNRGENQVAVCHFESHQGPNSPDFVIYDVGQVCFAEGGDLLIVGREACKNGHGAINRFGRDCDTDWWPL